MRIICRDLREAGQGKEGIRFLTSQGRLIPRLQGPSRTAQRGRRFLWWGAGKEREISHGVIEYFYGGVLEQEAAEGEKARWLKVALEGRVRPINTPGGKRAKASRRNIVWVKNHF